ELRFSWEEGLGSTWRNWSQIAILLIIYHMSRIMSSDLQVPFTSGLDFKVHIRPSARLFLLAAVAAFALRVATLFSAVNHYAAMLLGIRLRQNRAQPHQLL